MPALAWIDLPALLLLIAANSAPVLVARLFGERFAKPIDANARLRDGRPVFGPHKTWRGLAVGILAAATVAALVRRPVLAGAAFGALALAGDLLSSFIKRRFDLRSGRWVPLIDQVPEALLPLAVLHDALALSGAQILGTAATFTALDLVTSRFTERIQRRVRAGAGK